MKTFPLVWSNTRQYEDHIIMIGTFHLACGYLKMLGKKTSETRFAEILLEASLTTSGSLMGVISAKNYARSPNFHKILMEALDRLVLACFLQNRDEEVPFRKLPKSSRDCFERLATFPSKETKNAPLNDQEICSNIEEYLHFHHVWLTMCLLQAVKTNNFTVDAQYLCLMLDLFFSFGGHNYARYLTIFLMFIANIEHSHPGAEELLKREDGNAVFHCLREIPQTFGEISRKVLGSVLYLSPVIFIADMYKEDSIKGVEKNRRGVGDKLILSGEKTKHPKDWKVFRANDENKTEFIQLLLSTWRSEMSADILTGNEEETDTCVSLYCMYAKERGCKSARVRSPDSDIFFILQYHPRFLEGLQILFETGKDNTRRCIDATKLAMSSTRVLCSALLGYHAFTDCDSTSVFKGKGKMKGLKKAFSKLRESWEVKKVYTLRFTTLRAKCSEKDYFTKSKQFDLASLPSSRNVLEPHVRRRTLPDQDLEAREYCKAFST
uniref:Uncharacterized protein n=1 Tax=Octopus bimaculoides TaxID=37653 RepID=A0A0L8GYW0_OCTBM